MNQKYNDIMIPDSLDQVIKQSIDKGKKRRKLSYISRISSVLAACFAFFMLVQIPVVAATLEEIPIIGTLVRSLQIGEGGVRNDGLIAEVDGESGTFKIYFQLYGEAIGDAPNYKIEKKEAPYRLEITLNGIREFNYDQLLEASNTVIGIKDIYRNIYLDDSGVSFVIELRDNMDYIVSEYKKPGYIEVSLVKKEIQNQKVYYLQSKSMPQGEALSNLKDKYSDFGASIVKTENGDFSTVIGAYDTYEQATEKLTQLIEDSDFENEFIIASGFTHKNPKSIKD